MGKRRIASTHNNNNYDDDAGEDNRDGNEDQGELVSILLNLIQLDIIVFHFNSSSLFICIGYFLYFLYFFILFLLHEFIYSFI